MGQIGENLMIWDGNAHQPVNYNMYKHLCALNGYKFRTELYNLSERVKELFGD